MNISLPIVYNKFQSVPAISVTFIIDKNSKGNIKVLQNIENIGAFSAVKKH